MKAKLNILNELLILVIQAFSGLLVIYTAKNLGYESESRVVLSFLIIILLINLAILCFRVYRSKNE